MKTRLIAHLTVLAVVGIATSWARGEVTSKTFKELMSSADYYKAIGELERERIDIPTLAKSKLPGMGVEIIGVAPDSYAEQAGIKLGWILTEVSGRRMWHHSQGNGGDETGRLLKFVTPEGEVKKLPAPMEGRIGYEGKNFSRPELFYMQQKRWRDNRWDPHVVVAMVAFQKGDYELAEMAWFRAMKKGMPSNPIAGNYAAAFAFHRGDLEVARELSRAAGLRYLVGEMPGFFAETMLRIGLALGDLEMLERAARESDGGIGPTAATLTRWHEWRTEPPGGETLFSRVVKVHDKNLLPKAKVLDPKGIFPNRLPRKMYLYDRHIARGKPGRFSGSYFGPTESFTKGAYEVRVALSGPESEDRWGSVLTVALIDRDGDSKVPRTGKQLPPTNRVIAQVDLRRVADGKFRAEVCGGLNERLFDTGVVFDSQLHADGEKLLDAFAATGRMSMQSIGEDERIVVSLSRIGNEVEVLGNGRPLLRLPIDPEIGEMSVFVRMTGVNTFIAGSSLNGMKSE